VVGRPFVVVVRMLVGVVGLEPGPQLGAVVAVVVAHQLVVVHRAVVAARSAVLGEPGFAQVVVDHILGLEPGVQVVVLVLGLPVDHILAVVVELESLVLAVLGRSTQAVGMAVVAVELELVLQLEVVLAHQLEVVDSHHMMVEVVAALGVVVELGQWVVPDVAHQLLVVGSHHIVVGLDSHHIVAGVVG